MLITINKLLTRYINLDVLKICTKVIKSLILAHKKLIFLGPYVGNSIICYIEILWKWLKIVGKCFIDCFLMLQQHQKQPQKCSISPDDLVIDVGLLLRWGREDSG